MAEIDNPQVTSFCNQSLRVLADRLATLESALPGIQSEYNAKLVGTIIDGAGSENLIADGSATDGRTRVAGGDVYNLITMIQSLQTFFDAPGRRDVIAKWQVNGWRV